MKNENSKINCILEKYNKVTEAQTHYEPNSEDYRELAIEKRVLREVLGVLGIEV